MIDKNFLRLVQILRTTFLGNSPNRGHTRAELRRAIDEYAANADVSQQETYNIPENLADYVLKVARHAHKITDADLVRLQQDGYSEDDIFEFTISAALGASQRQLAAGLTALYGESTLGDTEPFVR